MGSKELLSFVIAQKTSSVLSMMGSGFILQEVVRSPKKRSRVFYRILAAMSCCDIVCSTWYFIGLWAIPKGTEGFDEDKVKGTDMTCTAQAFFVYFTLATMSFNACMALYYVLSIRCGWKEDRIRKYLEPYCYIFALGVGIGDAIPPLVMGYFGPANFWCSVRPSPETQNAWMIWYIPAWCILVFVTIAMIAVYHHVFRTESRSAKYRFDFAGSRVHNHAARLMNGNKTTQTSLSLTQVTSSSRAVAGNDQPRPPYLETGTATGEDGENGNGNDNDEGTGNKNSNARRMFMRTMSSKRRRFNRKKQSKKVAVQAFLYCLAFYLTLAWGTILRAMQAIKGDTSYAFLLLHMIFFPGQGFMNFLVYMRVRWRDWIKNKRNSMNNQNNDNDRYSFCWYCLCCLLVEQGREDTRGRDATAVTSPACTASYEGNCTVRHEQRRGAAAVANGGRVLGSNDILGSEHFYEDDEDINICSCGKAYVDDGWANDHKSNNNQQSQTKC